MEDKNVNEFKVEAKELAKLAVAHVENSIEEDLMDNAREEISEPDNGVTKFAPHNHKDKSYFHQDNNGSTGTNHTQQKEWLDPEEIVLELLPVEPLDDRLLPIPYNDFITDVAHRMQTSIDFPGIPLLIATSIIIGAACAIRPKRKDDWTVIPNLWGGLVAPPGQMKSGAIDKTIKLLNQIQNRFNDDHEAKIKIYDIEFEDFNARKKALEKTKDEAYKNDLKRSLGKKPKDPITVEQIKNQIGLIVEPEPPILRRLCINDSTIEKLSELAQQNPRGLLQYRDELVGWLVSLEKQGHEGDRSFFLEAWNGDGSYCSDRIGRGTTFVKNLCLSVLGGIQPDKLVRYLRDCEEGNDDGLLSRFQLLIYPDPVPNWKFVDEQPNLQASQRVLNILQTLCDADFVQYGAQINELTGVPYFQFDDEAQPIFEAWLTELEQQIRDKSLNFLLIEHLSKFRKLMPALALIFHLINVADTKQSKSQISADDVLRAIAWCEYLRSHADRIYALGGTAAVIQAANALCHKIKAGELGTIFSMREVIRKNWRGLNKKDFLIEVLEELIDRQWIRKIPVIKGDPKYHVNPKVDIKIKTNEEVSNG